MKSPVGLALARLLPYETDLTYVPCLQGYTYSVFNLVYETNVVSCRIWDALGFKRIGRIPSCGALRSYPDRLVDAIIYGRELGPETDNPGDEERFDKIRYYLKTGQYPAGADRAEKSRLRSAATHYKLLPPARDESLNEFLDAPPVRSESDNAMQDGSVDGALAGTSPGAEAEDRLMLKDKEVIADPAHQLAIARRAHVQGSHGGINKTTSAVAERYHWTRIKETVAVAIRNCSACKDSGGAGSGATGSPSGAARSYEPHRQRGLVDTTATSGAPMKDGRARRPQNFSSNGSKGAGSAVGGPGTTRGGAAASDPNGEIEHIVSFANIMNPPTFGAERGNKPGHAQPMPAASATSEPTPTLAPVEATRGPTPPTGADTTEPTSYGETMPVDPQIMELDAPEYRMYFSEDSQPNAATGRLPEDPTMGDERAEGSGESTKVGSDLTRQFLTTPFETDGSDGVVRI